MSQPTNAVLGHILSAVVGVSLAKVSKVLPDLFRTVCPSLSVTAAIGLMGLTNTMHPPGGATALIAILGGESVSALGYSFVLHPVGTVSF